MHWRKGVVAVFAVGAIATDGWASYLSISLNTPVSRTVHDVQWNGGSPPPVMVVGIEDTTATGTLLTAWQLGLEIIPDTGATGQIRFSTATIPDSYLLDERSSGLAPTFTGPSTTIATIGDQDALFTGVPVSETGQNLLQLGFDAVAGSSGCFLIAAVPGEFSGSSWYAEDFSAQEFLNVPLSGGAVVLGSITIVPVPEPGTPILLCAGVFAFASGAIAVGFSCRNRACRKRAGQDDPGFVQGSFR